jgi:hypothetical protein
MWLALSETKATAFAYQIPLTAGLRRRRIIRRRSVAKFRTGCPDSGTGKFTGKSEVSDCSAFRVLIAWVSPLPTAPSAPSALSNVSSYASDLGLDCREWFTHKIELDKPTVKWGVSFFISSLAPIRTIVDPLTHGTRWFDASPILVVRMRRSLIGLDLTHLFVSDCFNLQALPNLIIDMNASSFDEALS